MQTKSRFQNTLVNTVYGLINKVVNIVIPFVIRTAIIYILGIEYVGLNSLFSSILQVLNIVELGFSSAVAYCMYKPIAENDIDTLCGLLKYIKNVYHIIGACVFIIGLIIVPFLPRLISGTIPDDLNLVALYMIFLINTVIGYFFNAYKSTVLNAGQKKGIISNINTVIILIQGILQILFLVLSKNYYVFLLLMPLATILDNLWIGYATKKEYPEIVAEGNLSVEVINDIKVRIKGLFVSRICTTTRNAFDSIFISAFIGLKTVAIYGNYYYIIGAISSILNVFTSSMTASIGNSLVNESVEKNYRDFRKLNFIYNWIVGYFTSCLFLLIQPFMVIWMGKEALFSFEMVIVFCLYFYCLNMGGIRAVYHDAAGLWWEARYRAIWEAVLNIVLNIILTQWLGVFGTVFGTIISLFLINYVYGTQIVFKYYFKGIKAKQYFVDNFRYFFVTFVLCSVLLFFVSRFYFSKIGTVIFRFFVCTIVFNALYYLIHRRASVYIESREIIIKTLSSFFYRK